MPRKTRAARAAATRGRRGRRRPTAAEARKRIEDYHRHVADALIEQIERGTAPWTEAWKAGERALPHNLKSGKAYRGGNSVWLASTASRRQYSDERWGTYRQVKGLGGQVRRGERGCAILFWQFETSKLARDSEGRTLRDDKGQPVYETRSLASPRVYRYTVFNAEQCDGLAPRPRRARRHCWDSHEEAERVLERSGAVIEHSGDNRAYYDLRRDRVVLPFREQFPSGPSYYQSALHELGHWTGHPSRLDRPTLLQGIEHGYGSHAYAREELRAEISALMTGDRLNIGHDPKRHASYVDSWVQKLREDPREIYKAARDAQDMSDYLLGRGRWREQAPALPDADEQRAGPDADRSRRRAAEPAGRAVPPSPAGTGSRARAAKRAAAVGSAMTRTAGSGRREPGGKPAPQAWLPGMNPARSKRDRSGPSR